MKIFFLSLFVFVSSIMYAQNKVPVNITDEIYYLIKQGHYDQAESRIIVLLNQYPEAKPILLYLLQIHCKKRQFVKAKNVYAHIRSIRLTNEEQAWLYKQIIENYGAELLYVSHKIGRTYAITSKNTVYEASVLDKVGIVNNCFDTTNHSDFSNLKSVEELEKRKFPIEKKSEALAVIKQLTGPNYSVDTTERFIVATIKNSFTPQTKVALIKELEKTYHFYRRFFELPEPDDLITVYLLSNKAQLQKTAQIVHGIRLSNSDLGYSNINDKSLLSICDQSRMGTLHHELFHIMMRQFMPDIPVWLDEGTACLYSIYQWRKDTLYGNKDIWRTDVLRKAAGNEETSRANTDLASAIPSLKLLLNYSWIEFNGIDDRNICKTSINYALSNHLMLYLQQNDLLQKIFKAYQRPILNTDTSDLLTTEDNIAPFEHATGESIETTESKFRTWLVEKYRFPQDIEFKEILVRNFSSTIGYCSALVDGLYLSPKKGITSEQLREWSEKRLNLSDEYNEISDEAIEEIVLAKQRRPEVLNNLSVDHERFNKLNNLYARLIAFEHVLRKAACIKD